MNAVNYLDDHQQRKRSVIQVNHGPGALFCLLGLADIKTSSLHMRLRSERFLFKRNNHAPRELFFPDHF